MFNIKLIFRNSIISTTICGFIFFYFIYLIQRYIVPNDYSIPFLFLLGASIVIFIFSYCFINLQSNETKLIVLKFKMFNENSIKFLLLIIMCISVFIPPVSFSDTIIDWQHIEMLNYVRAILMFIGCIYLPGANFFNIILPNSDLHKKFDIEPFFLKLIIYPILSLTLIGAFVFFL